MVVTTQGQSSTPPVSVSGTGTTAKAFGTSINVPGTSRLAGKTFRIRGSGSVTTGTTGNVSLQLNVAYPSGQYPATNCTTTALAGNVATYTVKNNFVAGQYVTVAGSTNDANLNFTTAKVIASANANAITVAVTGSNVNVANDAACQITLASFPLFAGNTKSVAAGSAPFQFQVDLTGDASSNTVQGQWSTAIQDTIADGTQALSAVIPGVNFALEPAFTVTPSVTFGTSNANNASTLVQFVLES